MANFWHNIPGNGLGSTGEREMAHGLGPDYQLTPPVIAPFLPSLVRSETELVGLYRIDSWRTNSPEGMFKLEELKSLIQTTLPRNIFDSATYPIADKNIIGKVIPIAFGKIRGATGFPIDTLAKRFKLADHSIESFDGFFDEDGDSFTPDTINLSTAEFTWTGWDGSSSVFVDFTADSNNPIDCVKTLLTDSVRGANRPLTELDTASTGKGFGTNGARLDYIYGVNPSNDEDAIEFDIGLYVDKARDVFKWIQIVLAASFAIMYVDFDGLYQIKSWEPEVSSGMDEMTLEDIKDGNIVPTNIMNDIVTQVNLNYNLTHGFDGSQSFTFDDDKLRQLRSLTVHAVLDEEVPISNTFGAKLWAQRTVAMRGVQRREFSVITVNRFMRKEPGDQFRLRYTPLNINEVVEVLSVEPLVGGENVRLQLSDLRGFKNTIGFWTEDSPTFPTELGGGAMEPWDDTWSDDQKRYALENAGYWSDDDEYIDKADDPEDSFRRSRWK